MQKKLPEFYKSIVEASNKGELWGIGQHQKKTMETSFDPSVYK
tara:strand:+ start:704 stop:832 length:129 start_codon:yes stop_codon:yes gene_type:complete